MSARQKPLTPATDRITPEGVGALPALAAQVQINVPFGLLWERYLPLFLEQRLNPEIGLDGPSLDRFSRQEFSQVAAKLHRAGLSITLHAPFQDLLPGALDRHILGATRARLHEAFALVEIFQPRSIVCHLGFEARHYTGMEDRWLENSLATWEPLAAHAARFACLVTLENVYETETTLIRRLFSRWQEANIRLCLDVGHLQAFGGGDFTTWLTEVGDLVGQLHLHDNHGQHDEHLALGQGTIPLPEVLAYFARRGVPPLVTLEPHQENSVTPSLQYLATIWPWQG
jgi:sugar phosphate isomerase/epimerase